MPQYPDLDDWLSKLDQVEESLQGRLSRLRVLFALRRDSIGDGRSVRKECATFPGIPVTNVSVIRLCYGDPVYEGDFWVDVGEDRPPFVIHWMECEGWRRDEDGVVSLRELPRHGCEWTTWYYLSKQTGVRKVAPRPATVARELVRVHDAIAEVTCRMPPGVVRAIGDLSEFPDWPTALLYVAQKNMQPLLQVWGHKIEKSRAVVNIGTGRSRVEWKADEGSFAARNDYAFGFEPPELGRATKLAFDLFRRLARGTPRAEAESGTGGQRAEGQALGGKPGAASKGKGKRGKHVNARMLETMTAQPETVGWSAAKWAAYLKCAKSSVAGTDTWRKLELYRLNEKAERAKDRERNPRASKRKRD